MKRLLLIGSLLGVLLLASGAETPAKAGVRFGLFYNSLAPYGEWVDCSYGNVWRPLNMEHGWRPYLYGRWVWTVDYGWYWVSEEPFGWATFHYGRWVYDDFYGWVWAPDDVWGPAWVEWRYSNDYIGWAPLSPYARWNVSIGISFDAGWSTPIHYWNFVPCRSFTHSRVFDYVQPVERTRRFFGSTRGVRTMESDGDRIVNRGIDVGFVERRTQRRVDRADVVNRTNGEGERMVRGDGGRSRVEVYRPRIDMMRENDTRGNGNTGIDRVMRGGSERNGTTRIEVQRGRTERNGTTRVEVQRGGTKVEVERRTEPRNDVNRTEMNRPENRQRMDVPNRQQEVMRNNEQRREAWQQRKQDMRDNRQTDIQRTPQVQREERREPPKRELRTDEQSRVRREADQPQREKQQAEQPRRGRRP